MLKTIESSFHFFPASIISAWWFWQQITTVISWKLRGRFPKYVKTSVTLRFEGQLSTNKLGESRSLFLSSHIPRKNARVSALRIQSCTSANAWLCTTSAVVVFTVHTGTFWTFFGQLFEPYFQLDSADFLQIYGHFRPFQAILEQ